MDYDTLEDCAYEVSVRECIGVGVVLSWAEAWNDAVHDYDQDTERGLVSYLTMKAEEHRAMAGSHVGD